MLLLLAVKLAEHVIITLAALLVNVVHLIGIAEHLVNLHAVASVLRRISRTWHGWGCPALHSR